MHTICHEEKLVLMYMVFINKLHRLLVECNVYFLYRLNEEAFGDGWVISCKIHDILMPHCRVPRYCPSCKEHREATKQMSIWRLPHTLIIQLKRFSFRNFIWRDKIDKMVEFPVRWGFISNLCIYSVFLHGSFYRCTHFHWHFCRG